MTVPLLQVDGRCTTRVGKRSDHEPLGWTQDVATHGPKNLLVQTTRGTEGWNERLRMLACCGRFQTARWETKSLSEFIRSTDVPPRRHIGVFVWLQVQLTDSTHSTLSKNLTREITRVDEDCSKEQNARDTGAENTSRRTGGTVETDKKIAMCLNRSAHCTPAEFRHVESQNIGSVSASVPGLQMILRPIMMYDAVRITSAADWRLGGTLWLAHGHTTMRVPVITSTSRHGKLEHESEILEEPVGQRHMRRRRAKLDSGAAG